MAKPQYKRNRKTGSPRKARRGTSVVEARETGAVSKSPSGDPGPKKAPQPELPPRRQYSGDRLAEKTGLILETAPTKDYALLDSGDGQKLERYGDLTICRPEGQAIWQRSLPEADWKDVDAVFTGDTDEEGQGRWHYPKRDLAETWPMAFDGLAYFGRFTSFRHTGVFPEQAAHWQALQKAIAEAKRPVRMLNLFGYTGLASLVGARAGAEVTHVDASKKAIGWARENQELAGLKDKPIRWICDDAVKFCAREERRGKTYDVILLDPPAYGRGPKGEVWQLFDHLPYMLDMVRALQSQHPLMTVLTSYAIRASHFAIHEIMQEVFTGMNGRIESGELILRQQEGGRALSTSMFSRFVSPDCAT
ncbi:MAG: class I SAM-dependent rRNA methyltransferase [Rhizobiaceae bacterium]|nr:class I SAM-dependent methyltransferase [Hyphomicrobiales bacterium]NRB29239.1 class I SAM-dependent rRNA methyltransferase [Rhizobiaceae bacterium]